MEILDINFNFRLIEENIASWLDAFNVAKDEFFAGREDKEKIIEFGEKTVERISVGLQFLKYRVDLIDSEYMEDKIHNKNKLKKERFNLLEKISWYENLTDSIMADCDIFDGIENNSDEFGDQLGDANEFGCD